MSTTLSETINTETNIDTNQLNNKTFTHEQKKNLSKRIDNIKNKKCYSKLVKILMDNNINISINDNGVFFNLNHIPNNIIEKMEIILNYYESHS